MRVSRRVVFEVALIITSLIIGALFQPVIKPIVTDVYLELGIGDPKGPAVFLQTEENDSMASLSIQNFPEDDHTYKDVVVTIFLPKCIDKVINNVGVKVGNAPTLVVANGSNGKLQYNVIDRPTPENSNPERCGRRLNIGNLYPNRAHSIDFQLKKVNKSTPKTGVLFVSNSPNNSLKNNSLVIVDYTYEYRDKQLRGRTVTYDFAKNPSEGWIISAEHLDHSEISGALNKATNQTNIAGI